MDPKASGSSIGQAVRSESETLPNRVEAKRINARCATL